MLLFPAPPRPTACRPSSSAEHTRGFPRLASPAGASAAVVAAAASRHCSGRAVPLRALLRPLPVRVLLYVHDCAVAGLRQDCTHQSLCGGRNANAAAPGASGGEHNNSQTARPCFPAPAQQHVTCARCRRDAGVATATVALRRGAAGKRRARARVPGGSAGAGLPQQSSETAAWSAQETAPCVGRALGPHNKIRRGQRQRPNARRAGERSALLLRRTAEALRSRRSLPESAGRRSSLPCGPESERRDGTKQVSERFADHSPGRPKAGQLGNAGARGRLIGPYGWLGSG